MCRKASSLPEIQKKEKKKQQQQQQQQQEEEEEEDSTYISPPEFAEMWLKQNNMWLRPLMLVLLTDLSYAVENISADLGQNVSLPCKVPNSNKTITAVKWIRPDLGEEYVLFYRDEQLDPDNQHPSYQNRVDLQDKEMKDRDASLVLMDVMMNDRGTYECQVYQRETNRRRRSIAKRETISIINLDVHPSDDTLIHPSAGDKNAIIGGSVGAVLFLIVVIALVGFVISRWRRKKSCWFSSS